MAWLKNPFAFISGRGREKSVENGGGRGGRAHSRENDATHEDGPGSGGRGAATQHAAGTDAHVAGGAMAQHSGPDAGRPGAPMGHQSAVASAPSTMHSAPTPPAEPMVSNVVEQPVLRNDAVSAASGPTPLVAASTATSDGPALGRTIEVSSGRGAPTEVAGNKTDSLRIPGLGEGSGTDDKVDLGRVPGPVEKPDLENKAEVLRVPGLAGGAGAGAEDKVAPIRVPGLAAAPGEGGKGDVIGAPGLAGGPGMGTESKSDASTGDSEPIANKIGPVGSGDIKSIDDMDGGGEVSKDPGLTPIDDGGEVAGPVANIPRGPDIVQDTRAPSKPSLSKEDGGAGPIEGGPSTGDGDTAPTPPSAPFNPVGVTFPQRAAGSPSPGDGRGTGGDFVKDIKVAEDRDAGGEFVKDIKVAEDPDAGGEFMKDIKFAEDPDAGGEFFPHKVEFVPLSGDDLDEPSTAVSLHLAASAEHMIDSTDGPDLDLDDLDLDLDGDHQVEN